MSINKRKRVQLHCGEGKTRQSFKEECDINNIMKKFQQGQPIPQMMQKPEYGYASSQSFTDAMQIVARAKEEFMHIPSSIRAHFLNDTATFLDAIDDPDRRDEFVELGLIEPDKKSKTATAVEPSIDKNQRRESDKTPPEAKPSEEKA